MITLISSSSKYHIIMAGWPSFTPGVDGILYTASKTMLRLERQDSQILTLFAIRVTPEPNKWQMYYTDPNGVLEIPLKNIVNANAGSGALTLEIKMQDVFGLTTLDTSSNDFDVLPGIDEREALIPIKEDEGDIALTIPTVMPPNVIINPTTLRGSSPPGTIVEAGVQNWGTGFVWKSYAGGTPTTITPTGARTNEIPIGNTADTLELSNTGMKKVWRLEKPDSCTELVCIRWTSLTGATRQHYFPIVSFGTGNDKSVSLVNSGDGYVVRKNSYNSCVCRLTGLTVYGFWYYMDLLRASDVYAVMQGFSSPWVPVTQEAAVIETKDAVTPTGSGFYNFEFTLKMRHYDTI